MILHSDRYFWAAGLLAAMTSLGAQAAPVPKDLVDAQIYTKPQQLVAVEGDRKLNLECMGEGKPTVVLEAGLGSPLTDWRLVQARIAKFTRVCAYERAGYGFSDPAQRPSDVTNVVDDLHKLVRRAKIARPFVLVGHSIGGLYATVYKVTYPHDVAGMVLIDPSFAGQMMAPTASWTPAEIKAWQDTNGKEKTEIEGCLKMAVSGGFAKPENQKSDCLDNPPDPDPIIHAALNREFSQPGTYAAVLSEAANFMAADPRKASVDDTEGLAAKADFGAMPLVVLTAANHITMGGMDKHQNETMTSTWIAGHDALAARSAVGKNVTVKSSHFIQKEQPDIVVQTIQTMVEGLPRK